MGPLANALSGGAGSMGMFFKRLLGPAMAPVGPDVVQPGIQGQTDFSVPQGPTVYDDYSMGTVPSLPSAPQPQPVVPTQATAETGAEGGKKKNVLGSGDAKKTANALASVLSQQMQNKRPPAAPGAVSVGSVLNPTNKMLDLYGATRVGGK